MAQRYFSNYEIPITPNSSARGTKNRSYCYHLSCWRLFISSFIYFCWWITGGSSLMCPFLPHSVLNIFRCVHGLWRKKLLSKLITFWPKHNPNHTHTIPHRRKLSIWRIENVFSSTSNPIFVCVYLCVCPEKSCLPKNERWKYFWQIFIIHTWYTLRDHGASRQSSNGQTNESTQPCRPSNWVVVVRLQSHNFRSGGWCAVDLANITLFPGHCVKWNWLCTVDG
jgi:hypothetical protein